MENRIKELMEATIEKIGKFIKQTPCDTSGIRDLAETLTILERIYRDV